MTSKPSSVEDMIFKLMDQCKFLFFPEQWNQIFLDCSKNEVFALLLVYRRNHVNMTEISEYMNIPLNTVTGVVSRLEKKKLVLRQRSTEDKRVVTICLTESGSGFLKNEMEQLGVYFNKVMNALSEEEKVSLLEIASKVYCVFQQKKDDKTDGCRSGGRIKKITID